MPGFRAENVPNLKLITTDTKDVFISLDKLNKEGVEIIKDALNHTMSIEEYIANFKIPTKTVYKKKTPFVIENDSDDEDDEIKARKKMNDKDLIDKDLIDKDLVKDLDEVDKVLEVNNNVAKDVIDVVEKDVAVVTNNPVVKQRKKRQTKKLVIKGEKQNKTKKSPPIKKKWLLEDSDDTVIV